MTKSTGSMSSLDNGYIVEFIFEYIGQYGQPPTMPFQPTVFQRVFTGDTAREDAAKALAEWFMTVKEAEVTEDMFDFTKERRDS